MFRIIAKSLKTGVLTEAHPFDTQPSFGFPDIDFSRCVACDECARSCPTGAIQTVESGPGRKTVTLSYAACIQCRECVSGCPEQAIGVSHDVEVAAYTRQQLARTASFDVDPATGRGTFAGSRTRTRAPASTNRPSVSASASAAGSGARFTCDRSTREAATDASWRSPRRRTRSMTWNDSGFMWWRVRATRMCCWSPGP